MIYSDRLLRASVVVDHGGQLWLVPRAADGWRRRQRLTMNEAARSERLTPAKGIDAAWLGIPEETEPQDCPRTNERAAR